ncbi:MAG TPA: hypothetical protein PLV92_21360, partial [Pirellulaceae bacterium]|nr:hypothetical protein [Pirellulaceae bacterium]
MSQAVALLAGAKAGRQPTSQELGALARSLAAATGATPSLVTAIDAATALVAKLNSPGAVSVDDITAAARAISEAAGASPTLARAIVDAARMTWSARGGTKPTAEELEKLAADIAAVAGAKPDLVDAALLAAKLAKQFRDGKGVSAAELADLVRAASSASGASAVLTDAIVESARLGRLLSLGQSPSANDLGGLVRLIARASDVKPSLAAAIGASVEMLVKLPTRGVTASDFQWVVQSVVTATGAQPAIVTLVDDSLTLALRLTSGGTPTMDDVTSLGQSVFNVFGLANEGQLFTTTVSMLEKFASSGATPSLADLQNLTQFAFNVFDLPDAASLIGRLKVDSLSSMISSGFNIAASLWGRDIFTVDLGPLHLDVAALALNFVCAPLGVPCGSIAQLIVGLFSSKDKNSTPQHIEFSAREEYTAKLAKAVWVATIYDRIDDPALRARFDGTVRSLIDEGIRLAQERHPDGDKLYYAQKYLEQLLFENPRLLPPAPWLPYVSHNEDHLWDTDRETYSRMQAVWPLFGAALRIYETTY